MEETTTHTIGQKVLHMQRYIPEYTRGLLLLTARPWAERGSWFTRDFSDTAEIRFLGRDTVFCWSAVHLNKSTKCLQLLNGFRSESYRQSKRYKT